MSRKTFLLFASVVACCVGLVALFFPAMLLASIKHAQPSAAANAMARTVGILILCTGVLNLLVRDHPDSPTLRAVFVANLLLQLGLVPLDPLAYAQGAFTTLGSFVPNTLLHLGLAAGFCYYLRKMRPAAPSPLPLI